MSVRTDKELLRLKQKVEVLEAQLVSKAIECNKHQEDCALHLEELKELKKENASLKASLRKKTTRRSKPKKDEE